VNTQRLASLISKHSSTAVFVAVYITEAHASDEWPVGERVSFTPQPTSIEQRCRLARGLCNGDDLPMLVDNMSNTFESEFAAWPFRFFVVRHRKMALIAHPHTAAFQFDMEDLSTFLAQPS